MTSEVNQNNDEIAIKRVIEGYVEAFRARDLDGVMSIYAPEIVTFDVVPKLAICGSRCNEGTLGRGLLVVAGSGRL